MNERRHSYWPAMLLCALCWSLISLALAACQGVGLSGHPSPNAPSPKVIDAGVIANAVDNDLGAGPLLGFALESSNYVTCCNIAGSSEWRADWKRQRADGGRDDLLLNVYALDTLQAAQAKYHDLGTLFSQGFSPPQVAPATPPSVAHPSVGAGATLAESWIERDPTSPLGFGPCPDHGPTCAVVGTLVWYEGSVVCSLDYALLGAEGGILPIAAIIEGHVRSATYP